MFLDAGEMNIDTSNNNVFDNMMAMGSLASLPAQGKFDQGGQLARLGFRRRTMAHKVRGSVNRLSADQSFRERPWIAADGSTVIWSPMRVRVASILMDTKFETMMGLLIAINVILIMYEADYAAQCHPDWAEKLDDCPFKPEELPWLRWTNISMLTVYSIELIGNLFVLRTSFFKSRACWLDLIVVCVGWFSTVFSDLINVAWLRIFRIGRLMRAFKVVLSIRELYLLISGLASSFKALVFGTMLLGLLLAIWSVVLVEFAHPTNAMLTYENCTRCPKGFENTLQSMLTLFQTVIAGDSWGEIAIPVINASPALVFILVSIVLSVSMGVMNLILAVVVQSADEARARDTEARVRQQEKAALELRVDLLRLCTELDVAGTGRLTFDTFEYAWDTSAKFREVMVKMDISRRELQIVFDLLDDQGSGEVLYVDFVEQLVEMRSNDERFLLHTVKQMIQEFRTELRSNLEYNFQVLQDRVVESSHGIRIPASPAPEVIGTKFKHSFQAASVASKSVESFPVSEARAADEHVNTNGTGSPGNTDVWEAAGDELVSSLTTLMANIEKMEIDMAKRAADQVSALKKADEGGAAASYMRSKSHLSSVSNHSDRLQQHLRSRLTRLEQDLKRCRDVQAGLFNCAQQMLCPKELELIKSIQEETNNRGRAKEHPVFGNITAVNADHHFQSEKVSRAGFTARLSKLVTMSSREKELSSIEGSKALSRSRINAVGSRHSSSSGTSSSSPAGRLQLHGLSAMSPSQSQTRMPSPPRSPKSVGMGPDSSLGGGGGGGEERSRRFRFFSKPRAPQRPAEKSVIVVRGEDSDDPTWVSPPGTPGGSRSPRPVGANVSSDISGAHSAHSFHSLHPPRASS